MHPRHIALSAILAAPIALAAAAPAADALPPTPRLGVPRAAVPPALAAVAGDPAWAAARWIEQLGSALDAPLGERPQPTRVALLWDERCLYVRFVCTDDKISAPFAERDAPLYQGDACEVFLDPVGDGRHYVELQVAPNGALFDQLLLFTAEPTAGANGVVDGKVLDRDQWRLPEWNCPGIVQAASATAEGWIVDLALPAEAILRRRGEKAYRAGMHLRANLLRYEWEARADGTRLLTALNWSAVAHGCPHISPSRMGVLTLE